MKSLRKRIIISFWHKVNKTNKDALLTFLYAKPRHNPRITMQSNILYFDIDKKRVHERYDIAFPDYQVVVRRFKRF